MNTETNEKLHTKIYLMSENNKHPVQKRVDKTKCTLDRFFPSSNSPLRMGLESGLVYERDERERKREKKTLKKPEFPVRMIRIRAKKNKKL